MICTRAEDGGLFHDGDGPAGARTLVDLLERGL